jgi:HD superfamily phosphohydrolase
MRLPYDDLHLIADPLYGYIRITVAPRGADALGGATGRRETAEADIIDSRWVQRLKRIHQLQSSWWVFPTAEHSRFVHSLGAMHIAGKLARQAYPTLKDVVERGDRALPAADRHVPSLPVVEETLRLAGLLHDVGHGPFSHFCDSEYLEPRWGVTHEMLSQHLIVNELGAAVAALTRSPSGAFAPGEAVDPRHVAALVRLEREGGPVDLGEIPRWVDLLHMALSGAVTVDNIDYVRRDAYMCGVALGAVDAERLIYYTFVTEDGLTFHGRALGALRAFLNARFYMYENVYFHRVGHAIDMHLREIFRPTLEFVLPRNPLEDLDAYRRLTEWSLFNEVEHWLDEPESSARHRLGEEWQRIIHRDVKYHVIYGQSVERQQVQAASRDMTRAEFEAAIRAQLPAELRELDFAADVASQDPRPLNPMSGPKKIPVFDPSTGRVEEELLTGILDFVPAKAHLYRVFAISREHEGDLVRAAKAALGEVPESSSTNL